MKTIGHLCNNKGQVIGIISGPDATNQEIVVKGRVWRFDFDDYGGPLWLKANGEPRRCQYPNRAVWAAFETWHQSYLATKKSLKP